MSTVIQKQRNEIGELSPFIQAKLLRVLQERDIERVGESRKRKINIRVMAATNKDLFARVQEGNFRDDLYYRLKVFPIFLPPLRERKEDIPLLVAHFIQRMNQKSGKNIQGLSQEATRMFMDYAWPGNIRELENAVAHAFVLCSGDRIGPFDLPLEVRQTDAAVYREIPGNPIPSRTQRKKLTKPELLELLHQCDWNKAEVGRRVGRSRTSIWQYMKKWGIPLQKEYR